MNERIRLLAEQNGMWGPQGYPSPEAGEKFWNNVVIFEKQNLELFAQAIIRECVQTLLDNTPEQFINEAAEEDWDRGYDQAMKDSVHHIKEHFGVK
jgi:hypothetical protein